MKIINGIIKVSVMIIVTIIAVTMLMGFIGGILMCL